jgi:chorismate mutase/prephenate dehydratase
MTRTVHYLGPEGTFAHAATLAAFTQGERLIPGKSVLAVFDTVAVALDDLGVVPIENSIEGSVSLTLEALAESTTLQIVRELAVEVEQCLVSEGALSQVKSVLSHPHGLAQCKRWLRQYLPEAELVTTPSTAAAAQQVKGRPELAAVCSALAGKLAGVKLLARGIQDRAHNATRFVVLGHEMPAATGDDKTSILFDTPHERGALHRVLGIFNDFEINLTRIESRPMPGEMWHYIFFADLEGHASADNVSGALDALRAARSSLQVLGSYPRAVSVGPRSAPSA